MNGEHDPQRERDAQRSALPGSLVPRWLALLVLIALLSASAFSVCSMLRTEAPDEQRPGHAQP